MTTVHASQLPLTELDTRREFIRRHIGPDAAEQQAMLEALDVDTLEALMEQTVPAAIRRRAPMVVPGPLSEAGALAELAQLAAQNEVARSYIGMGYYGTIVPSPILRNVLQNPGWYTAYTPYQPEISQGRLEALLNFQQAVMDLTGMELANASLLDEATAAAEAMALCHRVNKKNRSDRFFVAEECHPQTLAVLQTRAESYGFELVVAAAAELPNEDVFGALLQYPATGGEVNDIAPLIAAAHGNNALVVVAADLLSLTLLTPPGELGADVVVGNSQRFGVPMGAGGPHAAFFATRDAYKRSTPGRIIGVSVDRHGTMALRMALQTREQHIRREKATSNICTAQALLAVMAGFYAVYHGPDGLRAIGARVHRLTTVLAEGLKRLGLAPINGSWFDTLTIAPGDKTDAILQRCDAAGVNLRLDRQGLLGISLDETTRAADVEQLWELLSGGPAPFSASAVDTELADASGIPEALRRQSAFLTHPVFNSYHSETELMRYMKRLENKDLALNHAMIALGSCTMKLNAATEMEPITWPGFADIHPFAPRQQLTGYLQLFKDLEQMLMASTGYDAVSLQPNAGSQGEYAGLLVIQRYHASRGEAERNVCLIPSSAHGTNPASAAMAGMKVVIVNCDENGNVDLSDLRAKAEKHSEHLAALMVTYPSTHGVFEEAIAEVCEIVHGHGGQVYVDGANLNALVGVCALAELGADVSHINLHKTFAIPHGGGGPGMGPIGVRAHLAPFLPSHPVQPLAGLPEDNVTVSAAPWGSAGILPISWLYARMMGGEGLTFATAIAILNANYVAQRLAPHYPVLYTGRNGRVAHECIIDMRDLKEATGITEEDVAKRLMDFGFHAPTMSFPVPGTLMIEPTESESKRELDRFIEAMISIREDIERVAKGDDDERDNPLKNAPHTAREVTSDDWPHRYSRQRAAYALPFLQINKYWPPVARIDNVTGDRTLICSCPSPEAWRED